jgi:hypothetical protein
MPISAERLLLVDLVERLEKEEPAGGATQHELRFNNSNTLQIQPMLSKIALYASLALR